MNASVKERKAAFSGLGDPNQRLRQVVVAVRHIVASNHTTNFEPARYP